MKLLRFLPFLIFLLLSPGILPAAAPAPVIMTEEWPPYNYVENGQLTGFSVELVKAVMAEMGISAKILVYPGARGEKYLQKYDNHMLFSLFRTPDRDKIYKWIGPISEDSVFFFKNRDNRARIQSLGDAKAVRRISCRHEGMILNYLMQNGFKNIIKHSKWEAVMTLVVEGKYDLLANTPLAIKYRLKKLNYPPDALEQTPVKLFALPLYIGCSKTMPDETINKWQEALDTVKASEAYKIIVSKYK